MITYINRECIVCREEGTRLLILIPCWIRTKKSNSFIAVPFLLHKNINRRTLIAVANVCLDYSKWESAS